MIISGAASGIGLATARRFAAEGAAVGLIDLDEERLRDVAASLTESGKPVFGQVADVSDEVQAGAAVGRLVEELDGLDGLVNAAGIDHEGGLESLSASDWDRLFAVNMRGPFLLCREALAHLRASGQGTIVNVSSGAGLMPIAGRSGYCASKAGLVMFGKALALEVAPQVRVNSVCPGAIDTPLLRSSYEDSNDSDSRLQAIRDRYALGRVGDPGEVADAILYLTSSESSFITGVALAVDGGRTFH